MSFLKIGSRAEELNVMSTTAEAIHGPRMKVFIGMWQIKSNCLFSDLRQSLIHVKEVGIWWGFDCRMIFLRMTELQNVETLLKSVEPMITCVYSMKMQKRSLAMIYLFIRSWIDSFLWLKRRCTSHGSYVPEYKFYVHFSVDSQQ